MEVKLNDFFKSEGMGEKITKSFMEIDIDGDKALNLAKELLKGFRRKVKGEDARKDDKSGTDISAV